MAREVPVPLVASVVLLLNEVKIIGYGNRVINIEKGMIFQDSDMKRTSQILTG